MINELCECNAVLKQDIERIQARKMFSIAYRNLNSIYGSNCATYFKIFKETFYDVKSSDELLELKGLLQMSNGQVRKNKAEYLDYASVEELQFLTDGVKSILKAIEEVNDVKSIYTNIAEIGSKARVDFFKKYNALPEQIPAEKVSIKKVKKAENVQKKEIFTTKPKTQECAVEVANETNLIDNSKNEITISKTNNNQKQELNSSFMTKLKLFFAKAKNKEEEREM